MTEETFQKKQNEIFDRYIIPEEFRGWFANIAWEQHHAYGREEVLNALPELVYGFDKHLYEYCVLRVKPSLGDKVS